MSRIIICKLGPRLGELRKLFDRNTSTPLVLNKSDSDDDTRFIKSSLGKRSYTIALPKLEPVENTETTKDSTLERINYLDNATTSEAKENSSQFIQEYDGDNLNLSNDISELFNFIPNPLKGIRSKSDSIVKQDPQRDVSENAGNENIDKYKENRTSEIGNSEHQIVVKSSQNFPLTDSLKDIILELDIGNSKSYELRAKGNETILLQNFNQHCEMEVFAIHAGNLYDEDKITEEKNVPILFC